MLASVYQALAQSKRVSDELYAFDDFLEMIGFPKVWEFEKKYADLPSRRTSNSPQPRDGGCFHAARPTSGP